MPLKSFTLYANSYISSFKKTIKADSDKSLSIRSFLIGAISQDISRVKNVLESEDVYSTISCLKKLGVKVSKSGPGSYLIYGKGLGSLFAKKNLHLNLFSFERQRPKLLKLYVPYLSRFFHGKLMFFCLI